MNVEPIRIGLFGGSFDPPHSGHVAVAERAVAQLLLDLLYWIPTGVPPHKETASAGAELRAKMVTACLGERDRLLTFELDQNDISFTIATITHLQSVHPGAEFFFILGSDAFQKLPAWKESGKLIESMKFAVYARPGTEYAAVKGADAVRLEGAAVPISSTLIRERLHNCFPARELLPEPVLAIIESSALYAYPMPDAMRKHVAAVEDAAAALAERWSLPRHLLVTAARYHDAYRQMPFDEQQRILSIHGETIDPMEKDSPILLHGRVAALRLLAFQRFYPDWNDTVNAVRFHTTGRANMSPIEETLFIADRIEKDWDRIEAVPTDRREAVRQALSKKLENLTRRSTPPHPRMIEACGAYGVAR